MKKVHVPMQGQAWNPLKAFPRNAPCFCGAPKKFKKCHALTLGSTVPQDKVEMLRAYLKTLP